MKKFGLILSQRSTWVGITAFASATGACISPEQSAAIVEAGVSVFGLLMMFWSD